ncbi:hypothetical protein INR49_023682 [Caranx melampygus]|nr:hypothetical protein INR49_023682 [Caranx melampygus]
MTGAPEEVEVEVEELTGVEEEEEEGMIGAREEVEGEETINFDRGGRGGGPAGFTDLSPEELRLEYYSTRASGDLQGYVTRRVKEPSTSDIFKLWAPAPVQASSFSFAAPSGGFSSSAAPSSSAGFGSAAAAPTQPPTGFGSSATPSASSFSFAAPTTTKPAATSGFGSASGFSFSSTANSGRGFGSGFGLKHQQEAAACLHRRVEGLEQMLLLLQQEAGLPVGHRTVCFHLKAH